MTSLIASRASRRLTALAGFAALLLAMVPEVALATNTLADVATNITQNQIAVFGNVIVGIMFVVGLFLVVQGVFRLKKNAEKPGEPLMKAIGPLAVGAFLMVLWPLTRIVTTSTAVSGTGTSFTSSNIILS